MSYCISKASLALLVRLEAIACGADLSFSPDVFYFLFFFQREISEMRGPTGVKFCTMVSTRPNFIMPVQNFGGHIQKKISGAKNMQNLARFRTTLKFGGKYLRSGWRYSKSDFYSIYRDSSCVRQNKSVKFGPVTLEIQTSNSHSSNGCSS